MQSILAFLAFFLISIHPTFSGRLSNQFQLVSYPNSTHSNFSLSKLSLLIGYAVSYQNSSSNDLLIGVYYPNGTLQYPEISLNNQQPAFNPQLCYIEDFGFVAVYLTQNTTSGLMNITAQVFNFSGVNITEPLLIANLTTANITTQVAQLNDFKGFIVGYTVNTSNNTFDVYYQIFNNTGYNTSDLLKANTIQTMGDISFSTLPYPAGFGIVYTGVDSNIYYLIINNKGDFIISETIINTASNCGFPAVQGMKNQFAVLYMCGTNYNINFYGQFVSLEGNKISSEFTINKYTMPKITLSALAYSYEHEYLIVIYANGEFIFSQIYNSTGDQVQTYTEVSPSTTYANPQVALINAGYVVMFSDDLNLYIYGQMMTYCPQDLFWNSSCLSNFPFSPPHDQLPYSYNICPQSNGSFMYDFCCSGLPCGSCEGEVCESCQNEYALNSTGNQCVPCPEGTEACFVSPNGEIIAATCNPGFFLVGTVCQPCQPNCGVCIPMPNNDTAPLCIVCSQGYQEFENACVQTCPSGTVNSFMFCCPEHCSLCNNGSYVCTECDYSYSLFQSGCLAQCPPGYASNNSVCEQCPTLAATCVVSKGQFVIESCVEDLYLYENQCLTLCPPNYFNVTGGYCCPEFCVSCNNGSPECSACQPDYFVYEGSCVRSCPDLTIANNGVCLSIEAMCELVCDVSYLCHIGFFSNQCYYVGPFIVIIAMLSVITGIIKLYILVKSNEPSILIKFLRNHAYSDMMVALTIFIVFDPSLLQGYNVITIIIFYGNLLSCFFTVEIFFYGYLKMTGNDFFDRYNQSILVLTYIGAIVLGFFDVVGMTAIYQSPYIIIGFGGLIITVIDGVIVFRLKKMNMNVDIKNLIVYPSILAVTWWLSSISFLGVSLNDNYFWIAFCASIMNYAQPMLNALLYGRRILTSYMRFVKVKTSSITMLNSQNLFTPNTVPMNRTMSDSLNTSENQLQEFRINAE